jgi:hypothetical protein
MGYMSVKDKTTRKLTEEEIDRAVTAQANDDSAWERPVRAGRAKPTSLSIPASLAARASFLARLHRTKNVEDWLARIIQERIELEEAAFVGVKQDLAGKTG